MQRMQPPNMRRAVKWVRWSIECPLAPRGLGAVDEFKRLQRLTRGPGNDEGLRTNVERMSNDEGQMPRHLDFDIHSEFGIRNSELHPNVTLKASVPGPYTLSGRLLPND